MPKLSQSTKNPAGRIADSYNDLMAITDPEALRERALALVASRRGISEQNARKYERTVRGARGLSDLQSFLTNFMLRADGLGVI